MTVCEFENIVADATKHCKGEFVVGVSGGADSVALLLSLLACGRKVFVVTCDFHLRGEESTRDRQFVVSLCNNLGVEFVEADMDVETYQRENVVSVEMACRDLRYDYFRKVVAERGAVRIAVAHNADDNIETLFLNLFRGTGIEGLRGMESDSGSIIRPLLSISRADIEKYLKEKRQAFVTDSTNLECDYRRNYIRNKLLPLIEERWPGVRSSIILSQENLRRETIVLRDALRAADGDVLLWDAINKCADAHTLVHRFASRFGASKRQIIEMTRHALNPRPGCFWSVHNGEIDSERDGLHFVDLDEKPSPLRWFEIQNSNKLLQEIKKDKSNMALYVPRAPENYVIRSVIDGDRMAPLGMKGTSAISDIMKDAKLTRREKRLKRVVCDKDTGEIIWLEGLKRSRRDLLSPDNLIVYKLSE